MLAFVLPLVSRAAAGAVGVPLAPLTIAALFALSIHRALDPAGRRAPGINSNIHLTPALEQ